MERLGVRILEGYNAIESVAALAVNTAMYNFTSIVGRLLLGVEFRLDAIPDLDDARRL